MTSVPAKATRRRRMSRADRIRQITQVAEVVFAERGYSAALMDDIADLVGVSKPVLYEYFGSKEGLLVACIRHVRSQLQQLTAQSVLNARSPEDALRRGLVAFFRFTDEHRSSWKLLRTETAVVSPAALAEIEAARQEQIRLHIELLAAYLPDANRLLLEASAEILLGACERLSIWYVRNGEVTPEAAAEFVMRLTWFGLQPRGRRTR